MKPKPVMNKPKRSGFYDRSDFQQAEQIYALVKLALAYGTPLDEIKNTLEENTGGFASWEFLFK